ncbi:MAG TPA: META domain-containing protein [Sphingomonadaceae bacterium]|nr:META domain-containing protein [Sphingomonadaceae bacterium]
MRHALSLLAILPALPLAGCVAQAASQHELAGSEWHFVAIDGEAAAARDTTLIFEADRVSANVGCNGMGGNWRVESDRLIAGPIVQTRMFCQGKVWDQEQAVSALLVAAPQVRFEGEALMLESRAHSARLERRMQGG